VTGSVRLAVFGGGRKRKIRDLRARAVLLGRLIAECQRALAGSAPNDDDVGGYRAARRVRAAMLESELTGHQAELDTVAAQIIALEAATRGQARGRRTAVSAYATGTPTSAGLFQRRGPRLGLIAATIGAAVVLLAAVTPVEGALALIPTLIAHEEDVIVVDPRTLSLVER